MLLQNQVVLAHLEAREGRADYDRVLELYRSSLDGRRRLGLPHILGLANLSQAEVEAGRVDEGRRHADEALRIGWARHDPLDWTIAVITFAQLAFVNDELEDGLGILGALLADRRTPSLERELDAVLAFKGVDRSRAATAITTDSASRATDAPSSFVFVAGTASTLPCNRREPLVHRRPGVCDSTSSRHHRSCPSPTR